jgi:hypothetical protein
MQVISRSPIREDETSLIHLWTLDFRILVSWLQSSHNPKIGDVVRFPPTEGCSLADS